jgi:hypothetical protein
LTKGIAVRTRSSRRIHSSVESIVLAEADVVWRVLVDFERWPVWSSEFTSVTRSGPTAPGGTFSWRQGRIDLTAVLTEVDEPAGIAWEVAKNGIVAAQRTTIVPEPDGGGCRVTSEEQWTGWLSRLLPAGPVSRAMHKGLAKGLHSLKAEAERVAGVDGAGDPASGLPGTDG